MKPIARWTVGPVSQTGLDILKHSIDLFSKIYPEFERIICFNNLNKFKLKFLEKKAYFFEQKEQDSIVDLLPSDNNQEQASGCGWKLCPPRLSIQSHELFIDNDIIIRKRIKEIDNWLNHENQGLISEGHPRCRKFGVFDDCVPTGLHVCAGLFGLPPYFDFAERINFYNLKKKVSIGGYDEQGLTASIITNMQNYKIIPISKIHISEDWCLEPFYNFLNTKKQIPDAIHFVGANRKPWHKGWYFYKSQLFKFL